jgi:hypothetical protein
MMARRHVHPRVDALECRALLSTLIVESEPNNAPRTADIVPLDPADHAADVVGQLRGGNRDFFRVRPDASGVLTITAEAAGRPMFLDLLDGATGRRLSSQVVGQSSATVVTNVAAGDTVLVRLRGATPRGQADYTLHARVLANSFTPVTPVPTPLPRPERPNPMPRQPGPGVPGPNWPGFLLGGESPLIFDASGNAVMTGTLPDGDVDTYTFTASRTGRVTMAPSGPTPIRIDALDASGRVLLTMYGDVNNFVSSFSVTQGASYSIRISRGPNAASGATVSYQVYASLR